MWFFSIRTQWCHNHWPIHISHWTWTFILLFLFSYFLFFFSLSKTKTNTQSSKYSRVLRALDAQPRTLALCSCQAGGPITRDPHRVKSNFLKQKTKQITREQYFSFGDQKVTLFSPPQVINQPSVQFLNTSKFNPNTQVLDCDLSWGLDNSYKPWDISAPISWSCIVV